VRTQVASESRAIDGTTQRLRDSRLGSPFTFSFAPPSVLLDALLGRGQARTQDAFDPLLRRAFQEAEARFLAVRADFDAGNATREELEVARRGMLGTRTPAPGQNIDIIEAAQRAMNNFSTLVDQRNQIRTSNFFATGPKRGTTLRRLEKLIARNGIRFNPREVEESQANQAAVSDLIQALDVVVQLNRILATPSLTLLVNPEQLQITHSKRQAYTDRSRFNYVFQSWGEEQVRLSVSGRSAGFVVGSRGSGDSTRSTTLGASGYQYASKWDSAAWQNLMSLFTIYRNNGYFYDTSGRPKSEAHLFVGSVEITYDQWVYVGNFDNFNYSYEEEKQHGVVQFSFDFTASQVFDRNQREAVRPFPTPPTPSPSEAPDTDDPLIPNQQAKATLTQTQTFPRLDLPSLGGVLSPALSLIESLDPTSESLDPTSESLDPIGGATEQIPASTEPIFDPVIDPLPSFVPLTPLVPGGGVFGGGGARGGW
jgi:hypothetical protein